MSIHASALLAQYLCHFKPEQNKRLVTALKGVHTVHSVEGDGVLELVVEVRKQQPVCEVRTLTLPTTKPMEIQVESVQPPGMRFDAMPSSATAQTPTNSWPSSSTRSQTDSALTTVRENKGEL